MSVQTHIEDYLSHLAEPSRTEMTTLHQRILGIAPTSRLWFLDGRDSTGKVVSNPSIGYGFQTIAYADGNTRDFYRVGISANTAGISVYVMGLEDKTYLPRTYASQIGKAKVTGYCIKFKRLSDINLSVLDAAIRFRLDEQQPDEPGSRP